MDAVEERDMAGNDNNNNDQQSSQGVVKGKRTKRQRLHLSSAALSTSSSSSAESPSNATEEDEDMANCLILLAQGRTFAGAPLDQDSTPAAGGGTESRFISRRFAEATTTGDGKAGFYVYECKSCNKCFPSFQALGGHRASHKKPKIATPSQPPPANDVGEEGLRISLSSLSKSAVMTMNKDNSRPRVHECSICGSEFSSGQALGGHMRRHRPLIAAESPETKKERNVLSLDLNLPAPSDDDELPCSTSAAGGATAAAAAFTFKRNESLVLPLVDCHY